MNKEALAQHIGHLLNSIGVTNTMTIFAAQPLKKVAEMLEEEPTLKKEASSFLFSELYEMIKSAAGTEKTASEVTHEETENLPSIYLKMLEQTNNEIQKEAEESTEITEDSEPNEVSKPEKNSEPGDGIKTASVKNELIKDILFKKAELEGLDGKAVIDEMKELENKNVQELLKIAKELDEKIILTQSSIGEPDFIKGASASDPLTDLLLSKANLF
jgi:HPt (histidine-containing phosphotransfer) domain-containing protein